MNDTVYVLCVDCVNLLFTEVDNSAPPLCTDEEFMKQLLGYDRDILSKYAWPNVGDSALVQSLLYHTRVSESIRARTLPPTRIERTKILNQLEQVMQGISFDVPDRPPTFDEFEDMVGSTVDKTTSPGYPWKSYGHTTNGQSMGYQFGILKDPIKLMEHYHAFLDRWEQLAIEPTADPINLFIKREPHKKSKIENGALRLISGVGITDNLVALWLFGGFSKIVVEMHQDLPVKLGIGLDNGSLNHIWRQFRADALEMDKSAWDWTMQMWHWELVSEYIGRVSGVDVPQIQNHLTAIATASFRLAGRDIQSPPGIMKSGYYCTLLFNSLSQILIHSLALLRCDLPWIEMIALGDDTLQKNVDHKLYIEQVELAGCKVKDVVRRRPFTAISFAGYSFTNMQFTPLYEAKHVYRCFYLKEQDADDTVADYAVMHYQNRELAKIFKSYLRKRSRPVYSDVYIANLIFGFE